MASASGHTDLDNGLLELRAAAALHDPIAKVDALREADRLIAIFGSTTEPFTAITVAQVQIERGRLLESLGHGDDATRDYSAVADRFTDHWVGAEALYTRSRMHHLRENDAASLADLRLIEERYAAATSDEARLFLALSRDFRLHWLIGEAGSSAAAGAWLEVIGLAESIIRNHGDEPQNPIQRCVARALLGGARAWRALGIGDTTHDFNDFALRARTSADEMFERFAQNSDPAIRALVAHSESENIQATSDPADALLLTERILGLRGPWSEQPASLFAVAGLRKGRALRSLAEDLQAREVFSGVVSDYRDNTDADVVVTVAWAWADSVEALHAAEHNGPAILEADRLASWAGTQTEAGGLAGLQGAVCRALSVKVSILEEATPPPTSAADGTGGVAVPTDAPTAVSSGLDVYEVAYAAAVADLTARFAQDPDDAIRATVASRLFDLAHHQRTRDHFAEAEASYRVLIDHFAEDPSSHIRDNIVATAELNLGFLLLTLCGRPADAVAVYDHALARFGNTTSTQVRAIVAKMNSSRSTAVTLLHDSGLSVRQLEDDSLGTEARDDIRKRVRNGNALTDAGEFAAAVQVYNLVLAEYPHPVGADLRRRICDVMVRTGHCLNRLNLWLDSVAHHHRFLDEFGTDVDMTIEKDLALGLSNLATALDRLGRHEEEVDAYGRILQRWSTSDVPYLINRCARVSWRKGVTEVDLGRSRDAERTYAGAARYLRDESIETRVEGAKSIVNLSALQRSQNRPADATISARAAVDALSPVTSPPARDQLAKAYLALARALAAHGDVDESCTAYEWLWGDGAGLLSEQLQATAHQEFLQLVGGPFKGALRRLKRSRSGRA